VEQELAFSKVVFNWIMIKKKSLKTSKRQSASVYRRTENSMANRKKYKRCLQTLLFNHYPIEDHFAESALGANQKSFRFEQFTDEQM
jgi:hypothetical protein